MNEISRTGIMIDKNNRRNCNNQNYRKTVSFDTLNIGSSKDHLSLRDNKSQFKNKELKENIPKSKTYEYVIDVEIEHQHNGTTICNNSEPIFKFNCKKFSDDNEMPFVKNNTKKSIGENKGGDIDKISIYFSEENEAIKNEIKRKDVDLNEVALDLTGLNSDSTSSSGIGGNGGGGLGSDETPPKHNENLMNELNERKLIIERDNPFRILWPKPKSYEESIFGAGKVKALKKYFDSFHINSSSGLSNSTPELRSHLEIPRNLKLINHTNKLTNDEHSAILKQLKEWSVYGSKDKPETPQKKICCIQKNDDQLLITKSTPNLSDLIIDQDIIKFENNSKEFHKKFPDAYIVKRKKLCQNNCTNLNDKKINLSNLSYQFASCPELLDNKILEQPHTPIHQTNILTLKQIKNSRNNKKLKENNRYAYGKCLSWDSEFTG